MAAQMRTTFPTFPCNMCSRATELYANALCTEWSDANNFWNTFFEVKDMPFPYSFLPPQWLEHRYDEPFLTMQIWATPWDGWARRPEAYVPDTTELPYPLWTPHS